MCGRIEVKKNVIDSLVSQALHIRFDAIHNIDLRPSQKAACLRFSHGQLTQVRPSWGIKPDWSKHPLINAQAETVAVKKTFSAAFALHRCVIPCTGWFEWTGEPGRKTKYRFGHAANKVLYMAGILFPGSEDDGAFVSLTTAADNQCAAYHHRMPFFIEPLKVLDWLSLPQISQRDFMPETNLPFNVAQSA